MFQQFPQDFKESLTKAKQLILDQIKLGDPIVIYGDYDADGVCSTAILYNTIKTELHYDCEYFIPNRFAHGYGLSVGAIDEILTKHTGKPILFITVDTGITAVAEAEYIKAHGHKLIITDHHQQLTTLPQADVIVWHDRIVAAAISWLLAKSLGSKNSQSIGLAATATVTDLQPLLGFNRTLVKEGLKVLNTNPPLGIKKLVEVSGKAGKEITTYDLGFVIGPRLNAIGRLESADESLHLLIEQNEASVEKIAKNLHETNILRQDKTLEMYEIAGKSQGEIIPKVLISQSTEYHEGIIGLVAAKLVQKYYRPVIVISLADGFGKGSARSIEGVDIIALLRNFQELFQNLGGHKMAAGFTIKIENIATLQKKLVELAQETILDEYLEPFLKIDLALPLEKVTLDLVLSLEQLKPHGVGNPEPVFISKNVGIASANAVGKAGEHLSFRFFHLGEKSNQYYKGILFNADEAFKNLKQGDEVDIAYNLKLNEFNGNKKIDLMLKDVKAR